MGTTSKMSIPYPASSDLVKDGATDMQSLAEQVDAKSGLVLLNTTNFTAQSSVSVDDVFSSNYDNYKIIVNAQTNGGSAQVRMRLRVSGTDASGTNYNGSQTYMIYSSTTVNGGASSANSSFFLADFANGIKGISEISLGLPNIAERTTYLHNGFHPPYWFNGGAEQNLSVAYTGFTIFPASLTITGSIYTYGVNN